MRFENLKIIIYYIIIFVLIGIFFYFFNYAYQKGYRKGFMDGFKVIHKTDTIRIFSKDTLRLKEIQIKFVKQKAETIILDRKLIFKEPFSLFFSQIPVEPQKQKEKNFDFSIGMNYYLQKSFSLNALFRYKKFNFIYQYFPFEKIKKHGFGICYTLIKF
jgi:preprotein translocase subunit YajC